LQGKHTMTLMSVPGRHLLLLVALVGSLLTFIETGAALQPTSGAGQAEISDATTLTTADSENEFPALATDARGRLRATWVSWNGQNDRVMASVKGPNGWSQPIALSGEGDHWRPAMSADREGRIWTVWSQNQDGNWDLWGRRLENGGWSPPTRLTNNPGNDLCQKLATDSKGDVWMVWQAVVDRNYEIQLARLTPDGLRDQRNLSQHPASDWEPAIAAGRAGQLFVAWDSYRGGSYDILLREIRGGEAGPILAVAATPDYEAHAAAAVDQEDRLWLAWDNGGPKWAQHDESLRRLHRERSAHLACVKEGRLHLPATPLASILTGELSTFCELPELTVDRDGRLWLFVRHLHDVTPPGTRAGGRPNQPRGIWNPYVACYDGEQWTTPLRLPDSNGRNDMRVATCLDAQGQVCAAWADDGRKATRAEEPTVHAVHVATLAAAPPPTGRLAISGGQDLAPAEHSTAPIQKPNRHTLLSGGKTYQLLFGDTHRHTDISRCSMNYDGSLMDTYRYAIDVAQLDFLGISDHDQDILKHRYDRKQSPLLDYAWWRSQKYCDLFLIPDSFLPIYGYEHGGSYAVRGGHKNVMFLERGMPCYEQDSPEELFLVLRDKQAVVIPHQLADGGSATDWSKWNPQFERVAEIFQTRGSYEYLGAPGMAQVQRKGHYFWDALAGGARVGTIASSDHGLVHGAYAGVYAESFSRRGVLDALRARRSLGATETVAIELRIGDRLLGEEVTTDRPPMLEVFVRGTAPLKQVQIVKDGKFIHTATPGVPAARFRYTDMELAAGDSAYYYVRAEQQDGQWAWSSAIWVRRE
jgi:hypothetical protein